MRESRAILTPILGMLLIITMLAGVKASTNTCNWTDSRFCVSTDKTTYSPGDKMTVTVGLESRTKVLGSAMVIVQIFGVQCQCVVLSDNVATLQNSYPNGWQAVVNITLPANLAAGPYDVNVVFKSTIRDTASITVT